MDNILIITIAGIFLAAFVASMIRYRTVDKCLKDFQGYLVSLDFKNGDRSWGKLRTFHNGMELEYLSPHLDSSGAHFETSFIVYQSQYSQLRCIERHHDELSPENQARREKVLRETYHPGFFKRIQRRIRNLFNLLRDAFGQALSVLMGSMKKTTGSAILKTNDSRIQDTAKQLMGSTSAAYEPILERHIGNRVVMEFERDGKMVEHCGVLKDYSDAFITLLDVPVDNEHAYDLADFKQLELNRDLDFDLDCEPGDPSRLNLRAKVSNKGEKMIHVCHVEGLGYSRVINADIEPGETFDLHLENIPLPEASDVVAKPSDEESAEPVSEEDAQAVLPQLRLWIRGSRRMDLIVPRASGFVRHGADSVGGVKLKFSLNLIHPRSV